MVEVEMEGVSRQEGDLEGKVGDSHQKDTGEQQEVEHKDHHEERSRKCDKMVCKLGNLVIKLFAMSG